MTFFKHFLIRAVKTRAEWLHRQLTQRQLVREVKEARVEVRHFFKEIFSILLGVLSAGFGLESFLIPNSFIDGGAMGIALISAEVSDIPLSVLIVLINIPFVILAFTTVNRSFALRSIVAIVLLAIVVQYVPFPVVTQDRLLIAVFGGFFLGLGIGLSIRGGAVIDGTEILALYITKQSFLTVGDAILIINVVIFGVAAYVFSIEIALYAMLTYLAASKTVDFVIDGIEEYVGVTIISDRHEEVRLMIVQKLGRGCTIYKGLKGFAQEGEPLGEVDIVYTLVTRLELSKLKTEIDKVDSDAFVIMHTINEAKGGMIKKRALAKAH
jgi:uncharacterized membrane-anchored protein YitT (DUF2179 family)